MNYYISPSGNDNHNGTEDQPWQTLARASQYHYYPGDGIYLEQGMRFPGTLILSSENVATTSEQGLQISPYWNRGDAPMGSHPIIAAGDGDGITIRNVGNITIGEIIVEGSGYNSNTGWGVRILNDAPHSNRLSTICLDRLVVSGFRWAGIYVGGIPNDLPAFPAPRECLYGFRDVAIKDCEAWNNMYYGVYVSGPLFADMSDYANENVLIQNCSTWDNYGDKFYTANHSGSGILLDNCQTGSIEMCRSYNNGGENGGLTGGPCGIWTHASNQIRIRHCQSYANRTAGTHDGGGFDMDGGVTHSTIEHCQSWENDGAGFLVWNYEGAPFTLSGNCIRHCTSTNDGRKHSYGGVHIGTSGDPLSDITVQDCQITQSPAPGSTLPPCIWVGGRQNQNIVFQNVTLSATDTVAEVVLQEGTTGVLFLPRKPA